VGVWLGAPNNTNTISSTPTPAQQNNYGADRTHRVRSRVISVKKRSISNCVEKTARGSMRSAAQIGSCRGSRCARETFTPVDPSTVSIRQFLVIRNALVQVYKVFLIRSNTMQ